MAYLLRESRELLDISGSEIIALADCGRFYLDLTSECTRILPNLKAVKFTKKKFWGYFVATTVCFNNGIFGWSMQIFGE